MNNFDNLKIGSKIFSSRLILGSGKYRNVREAQESIQKSECEMVTVAIRRAKSNQNLSLLNYINWNKIWFLPNTAGCRSSEEAIRIARLGREINRRLGQEDNNYVKLEVVPDYKYLFPDPIGTLEAAEYLVKRGFEVLPYINADPVLARQLEEVGCVTVMPLGAPIGSGQGLKTLSNLSIIIENANIPVILDAGVGSCSDATKAMEIGTSAILLNSAIANAYNPPRIAEAFSWSVSAGRSAYLAGQMEERHYATPSSPTEGVSTS